MKKTLILLSLLTAGVVHSQNNNEVSVRRVVDTFYDGFNERDSVKMKMMLSEDVLYQNVDEVYGQKVVEQDDLHKIIRTISAIPKSTKFRQEIESVLVNADDNIANAWVRYKFYLYDAYYHCGSSSIQLAKEDGDWKIISILDNYSRDNCNQ